MRAESRGPAAVYQSLPVLLPPPSRAPVRLATPSDLSNGIYEQQRCHGETVSRPALHADRVPGRRRARRVYKYIWLNAVVRKDGFPIVRPPPRARRHFPLKWISRAVGQAKNHTLPPHHTLTLHLRPRPFPNRPLRVPRNRRQKRSGFLFFFITRRVRPYSRVRRYDTRFLLIFLIFFFFSFTGHIKAFCTRQPNFCVLSFGLFCSTRRHLSYSSAPSNLTILPSPGEVVPSVAFLSGFRSRHFVCDFHLPAPTMVGLTAHSSRFAFKNGPT